MKPINTRSAADAACSYAGILHWPLLVGHRFRPRQGCTCERPNCPTPGAHPLPGRLTVPGRRRFARQLRAAPSAALIAPTTAFDALVVPQHVGLTAIVSLESLAPVPCLIDGEHAVLLVLPATGRYAQALGLPIEVRTGPDQWVALPPSHGVRWDTHPWIEQTTMPVQLLHGQDAGRHLRAAFAGVTSQASEVLR